jgi:trehalose 6-phosphate synthase/phosphatase
LSQEHPEWRDKVLLVQIAVPSRMDVPEYQKLKSLVRSSSSSSRYAL